jgi:carbonic anhydrase
MRIAMIWLIVTAAWVLSATPILAMEQGQAEGASAAPPHWSYSGEHGPSHWGDVAADDAVCGNGKSQSPIDLVTGAAKTGKEGNFKINYERGAVALLNNGHTVQADVSDAADTVTLEGTTYTLAQFHFHTPSEHTMDGKGYPLEIHLVNKDASGHTTVVGVFVRAGAENKLLAPIFSALPSTATPNGMHMGHSVKVDISAVLPKDHKAFVYMGSLTTPPCTEGVHWIVLAQPIEMSNAQINSFRTIFNDNHRPLQKINGREVDRETE